MNKAKKRSKKLISPTEAIELLEQWEEDESAVLDIETIIRCLETQQEASAELCTAVGLADTADLSQAQKRIIVLRQETTQATKDQDTLKTNLTTAQATITTLTAENTNLKATQETLQAKVDTISQEQETLHAQVNARKEKLTAQIIGKHELIGHDTTTVEAFKTRAKTLTFEELDAELTTLTKQLEESWGPAIRISTPADGADAITRPLNLARLQGFRV